MNINAKFGFPTLIEHLVRWSTQENNPVIKSRLETIATLCMYIEDDERWFTILQHEVKP